MRTSSLLLLCAGVFSAFPACSGQALDLGQGNGAPAASDGGTGGQPGQGDTGSPSPTDPPAGGDITPAAAQARCDLSVHGPAAVPTTPLQFTQVVSRRWFKCGGQNITGSLYQREDGIEYTADGHFYLLHENASGGFDRLVGPNDAGRWAVNSNNGTGPLSQTDTTPGSYKSVFMYVSQTSFGDELNFEVDPSRMEVVEIQTSGGAHTWFVPLTP